MKKDLSFGQHTVRIVTTSRDYGSGCFRPGIRAFLTGPNGSVNGIGPKGWPLVKRHRLYATIPHLPWYRAYRLRRFGGLWLWQKLYPWYRKLGD